MEQVNEQNNGFSFHGFGLKKSLIVSLGHCLVGIGVGGGGWLDIKGAGAVVNKQFVSSSNM